MIRKTITWLHFTFAITQKTLQAFWTRVTWRVWNFKCLKSKKVIGDANYKHFQIPDQVPSKLWVNLYISWYAVGLWVCCPYTQNKVHYLTKCQILRIPSLTELSRRCSYSVLYPFILVCFNYLTSFCMHGTNGFQNAKILADHFLIRIKTHL